MLFVENWNGTKIQSSLKTSNEGRIYLPRQLHIYLLFELNQHRSKHTKLSSPPGNLQQGQHHVLFVLLGDQVLRLEHDDIHDLEAAAELDEVVDIVPGKPLYKENYCKITFITLLRSWNL